MLLENRSRVYPHYQMSIKLIQSASVPTHITQRSTTQNERAFEGPDSSSGNSSSSLGFFRTDRLPAHPNKRQRKVLGWSCPPHRRKEDPSWKAIQSRAIMGLWTPRKKRSLSLPKGGRRSLNQATMSLRATFAWSSKVIFSPSWQHLQPDTPTAHWEGTSEGLWSCGHLCPSLKSTLHATW